MTLVARNIKKYYDLFLALDNVDITLSKGVISVLMGPSGCGKTTLLKSISMIDAPDSGSIEIDNTDINKTIKDSKLWPMVTVVFQELYLWPHLNIEKNILLATKNKYYDMEYYNFLLDKFDMIDHIHKFPREASLGQQQRTAIIRALILKPKYLLLDEITSSLDYEQSNNILETLNSFKSRTGILLITHQIDFIRRLCNDSPETIIHFMDKGKIIEKGGIEVITCPSHIRLKQFFNYEKK